MKNRKSGFVAILSLLIISTVAMIFSIAILNDGVTNSSLSLNSLNYEQARLNAKVCLEDILIRLRKESAFTKNLSYNISANNSCSSSMNWGTEVQISQGITERPLSLDVTGISTGFSRKFRYSLKVKKFDINESDGSKKYLNSISFTAVDEITI